MDAKLYLDLMDIIEAKDKVIERQSDLIADLLNENLEKENMINLLTLSELE